MPNEITEINPTAPQPAAQEVPANLYGATPAPAPATSDAEQAWFEDDETGYHAEIELNGQTFRVREASDAIMKQYSHLERALTQSLQKLSKEQKDKAGEEGDGLSAEELDEFENKSSDILARQFANADVLLCATLVGWSLPRKLNPDNIRKLSKSARRKLAELIGQRSTLGADEQSFLDKRSRK